MYAVPCPKGLRITRNFIACITEKGLVGAGHLGARVYAYHRVTRPPSGG